MKSQGTHPSIPQGRRKIDRATWQREAQAGELAYHKAHEARRSDDFLERSAQFFEQFGLCKDDYRGKVVIDLGAGSKLRSKYFADSTLIAIEPLAERFMAEIAWCDLRDADEVYSTPAEERIERCVDRADLIVSINVLDHCYDFERIIDNVCAYLREDGLAFLSFDKHESADEMHPLSLDEAICNRTFAEKGLVIENFSTGFGNGIAGVGVYGHGPYCLNYRLRKSRQGDRADARHAARITLDPKHARGVLCDFLGPDGDEANVEQLNKFSLVDWHTFVRPAVQHNLAPVLYKRLKALGQRVNVPAGIWRRLQDFYLDCSGRSMRLYNQLARVLEAFHAEDIPVIVLKGAYLAHAVYGNAALRPMQDLDLLVKKSDLPRAEEMLLRMGYGIYGDRAEYEENHFHFQYAPSGDSENIPVEIHWHITYTAPFRVDTEGLWARARPATIAGVETLTLSPEDLLLHVCVHNAHGHVFEEGLRPHYDTSAILQYYGEEMDWEQVQRRADRWGIDRCAYLTLRFARDLLGAAVPEQVLAALEPGDLDAEMVAWAEERIFAQATRPEFDNWGRLEAAERLRDKIGVFLRACFPPAPHLAKRYAVSPRSARVYFYYPVYLKHLLQVHGPRAWRLLRGDREMKGWVGRQGQKFAQQARGEAKKEALEAWLAAGSTRQ